jgi:hypothetical protein
MSGLKVTLTYYENGSFQNFSFDASGQDYPEVIRGFLKLLEIEFDRDEIRHGCKIMAQDAGYNVSPR